MADMETVRKRVCTEPGCTWSAVSPGLASHHTRATGHNHFKTVKETREKAPSRISYQPGYGPDERAPQRPGYRH